MLQSTKGNACTAVFWHGVADPDPATDGSTCVNCEKGTYGEDGLVCTDCPAGMSRMFAPLAALPSKECLGGLHFRLLRLLAGRYSPISGRIACVDCPAKTYFDLTRADDASRCIKCATTYLQVMHNVMARGEPLCPSTHSPLFLYVCVVMLEVLMLRWCFVQRAAHCVYNPWHGEGQQDGLCLRHWLRLRHRLRCC